MRLRGGQWRCLRRSARRNRGLDEPWRAGWRTSEEQAGGRPGGERAGGRRESAGR